jgi:hypothetical protein
MLTVNRYWQWRNDSALQNSAKMTTQLSQMFIDVGIMSEVGHYSPDELLVFEEAVAVPFDLANLTR